MIISLDGLEYELATTLRVAYKIQGQHNHKPYNEVFSAIGDMPIEDQIGIIYAAFEVANSDAAKLTWNKGKFLEYYLDNYNLTDVMDQLKTIIEGITGMSLDEPVNTASSEPVAEEEFRK